VETSSTTAVEAASSHVTTAMLREDRDRGKGKQNYDC
jgi:hypothetical protein